MRINPDFELMQIADECLAVPVGQKADEFHGIVVLSEPAYFLLSNMAEPKTREDLVHIITEEYDVDVATADSDLGSILGTLLDAGVLI